MISVLKLFFSKNVEKYEWRDKGIIATSNGDLKLNKKIFFARPEVQQQLKEINKLYNKYK